jgi:hypothetical protein
MNLTPNQRGLIHVLAALTVPVGFFDVLPQPWNVILGALAAGAIAFVAFLDQSLSK